MTNDALFRALGWALTHSIWQGALAALLLLIFLPRLRTARHRYWAAYSALAAVFVAAIVTCCWAYEPGQHSATAMLEEGDASFFLIESQALNSNLWQVFSAWLETNHTLIVVLWLLGFSFFLLRLAGGLWQIRRLRTQGTTAPEAEWLEKFNLLQEHLGFTRMVTLLESSLVQTPMAIGWLKPVVLLPIGLVNRLSMSEVEAVLAHELAHIARKDWILNLFQAFIESLFYYHPAVWWMSSVVRRERENCCDDAALAATGNPLAFAKALVQVQEMAVPVPTLALGLSGKRRRPLLDRVRRILNQPQQKQKQVMEKITATVILLAFLALVGLKANSGPTLEAAFSKITNLPAVLFNEQGSETQILNDTVPKPKSTQKITREDDDQRVEAEYQDGKLTRLNIDGKEIPESEFGTHQVLVEELLEEMPPSPPTAPSNIWHSENGHVWTFPKAPKAPKAPKVPRAFWFSQDSPEAPETVFTPLHGGSIRVITDKDDSGNTIIRLDNNGESTEVIVKDNEVYVNGKKLEEGDELDIPGLKFGGKNEFFFPEGLTYDFKFDNEAMDEARALHFERFNEATTKEELARSMEKQQRLLRENRLNMERQMKQAERALKRSQRELERHEKRLGNEMDVVGLQENKFLWGRNTDSIEKALRKELLRDGVIANPDKFSLEITEKRLKVNGKKQSKELHEKYLELLERRMGTEISGKSKFHFNFD